jgi:hypothetical protein
MERIASSSDLQIAIQRVSLLQAESGKQLKMQLLLTYESLQPASLFKNMLNDSSASPGFIDRVLSSLLGLLGGYMSKKLSVGNSDNPFRKVVGSMVQFLITNVIALQPAAIMSIGKFFVCYLIRNKETNSKKTV